jgi:biopolymer transport protein ExbB
VFHIGSLIQTLAKGGPVMIPLVICSVVALAVVVERLGFWWRQGDVGPAEHALELAERGKLDEALEVARRSHSATARVIAAGLAERQAPPAAAMEAAVQTEMSRLRSYLPVLDTIITLSPLLGLLGTVTGMIAAFGILSTSGMNQPNAITGGVAEALIATAAGLAIAIATLVPYNYFLARAEQALDAVERLASRLDLALREQQVP